MDYLMVVVIYALIGLVIGISVYYNVSNLSHRKRKYGAVVSGIVWPLIVGLFFVMLLDNLKDYLKI